MNSIGHNFHVLTGASGGGKSSLLAALKERGHAGIEEAGRRIVAEQLAARGNALPWCNVHAFIARLLERSVAAYEAVVERAAPVFFDRGILEPVGWYRENDVPLPEAYRDVVHTHRYAETVFVVPPWEEIYETDRERRHDFQAAVEDYRRNVAIYDNCGYRLIEIPRMPIAERAAFVLGAIAGN